MIMVISTAKIIVFELVVRGSPTNSAPTKRLVFCWSFGVAQPSQQRQKDCFCWSFGEAQPIQQHKKSCFCAGRSGQPNRFGTAKTIGFVLAVRGSPTDSAAQKELLLCWSFGAAQPIRHRQNDWFSVGRSG